MNRDEIILMAREAHLVMYDYDHPSLERFAALAAAYEREQCAKFVEEGYVRQFERPWREDLAAAIRARGNHEA